MKEGNSHIGSGPLVIYELGPGNGTLCDSILAFLHQEQPNLQVEYHLIEISERMHRIQKRKLGHWAGKSANIRLIHHLGALEETSGDVGGVFDERPCFVLAMEVLDNLGHDLIRFEAPDGRLMEGIVETRSEARYGAIPGKLHQAFQPAQDSTILAVVGAMEEQSRTSSQIFPSLNWSPKAALGEAFLLGWQSPWRSEWIPTGAYRLFEALHRQLPAHRLVASDFNGDLPDAIPGWRGPVVQTRYRGMTVACRTVLVQRGLFDIFFPVDPELMGHLWGRAKYYAAGNKVSVPPSILSHAEFVKAFGDLSRTQTRSGYNPMIDDFTNVSMLLT